MPPLNEGTILYMPAAVPGISIREAARILQIQDRILKKFPEVESVFGKAGQADTVNRPCSAVDVRDRCAVETTGAMGGRCDLGEADRGHE